MSSVKSGKSSKSVSSGTRYDKINIYRVKISSLRNQLKDTKSMAELTELARTISDLEALILDEKLASCVKIMEKKDALQVKIEKLQRKIDTYKSQVYLLDKEIDLRQGKFSKNLESRINALQDSLEPSHDEISECSDPASEVESD
jgi:predicted nuclease with TOPRIM domain